MFKKVIIAFVIILASSAAAVGFHGMVSSPGGVVSVAPAPTAPPPSPFVMGVKYTLDFPSDTYPQTAAHIRQAVAKGKSNVCTIDRTHAEEHRKASLKGVPVMHGYDRDEWPMAMCAEGGAGADIMYVTPEDNRGAGSWISNVLEKYPDGTPVQLIVK